MKKLLKTIAPPIAVYLLYAFAAWNINPETWEHGQRFFCAGFMIAAGFIAYSFTKKY